MGSDCDQLQYLLSRGDFFSGGCIRALAGLFKDFLILAHAFVTSCLDYYDAFSTCVTQSSLNHLRLV